MNTNFLSYIAYGDMTVSRMLLLKYRELGMTDSEFVLFLQLQSEMQRGIKVPDIEKIADRMKLDPAQVYSLLHAMVEKNLLELKTMTASDGKKQDYYDFDGIYHKLFQLNRIKRSQQAPGQKSQKKTKIDVFNDFEVEFGRALSPIEIQTIDSWMNDDHYDPDLIIAALKVAVLSQVYNLKYIDKVLMSWEKRNIRTVQEAQNYERQRRSAFRQQSSQQGPTGSSQKKMPKIPLIHWSDSSDKEEGKNAKR